MQIRKRSIRLSRVMSMALSAYAFNSSLFCFVCLFASIRIFCAGCKGISTVREVSHLVPHLYYHQDFDIHMFEIRTFHVIIFSINATNSDRFTTIYSSSNIHFTLSLMLVIVKLINK